MDILSKTNWVDLLAIIIMFRISYVAFQDGLSREIFPLIASVFTIVFSLHYYTKLAFFISKNLLNLPIGLANFFSFMILALGIGFLLRFIRVLLDKIIKVTWHPMIERFGGLVTGMVRACTTVSLVLTMIALIPLSYFTESIKDRSLTGMYFLRVGPVIYEKMGVIVPAIKAEGDSAFSDNIIKDLFANKPAPKTEKKEKIPDWEKPFKSRSYQ